MDGGVRMECSFYNLFEWNCAFYCKRGFFFIICLNRMIGFFICCFRFEVNITFMNRKDEWKILKFYSICTITCKVIILIVSIIMVNWKWSIKYTMNVFEIQLHARFHIFFFFFFWHTSFDKATIQHWVLMLTTGIPLRQL